MGTQNIIGSVSNAIAGVEGFGADPSNRPTRNNNPGDITDPSTGNFLVFGTQEAGYDKLNSQVSMMVNGGSHIYNANMSLNEIGTIYAKSDTWGGQVADRLGVPGSTTIGDIVSGKVPVNMVPQPQGDGTGGTTSSQSQPDSFLGVNDVDTPDSVPVYGATIPEGQLAAVQNAIAPSLVIESGLGQAGWDTDPSIVRVGGVLSSTPSPVSFQIFFKEGAKPLPVTITLLASLRTHQKALRHVMNKQQTRTGVLINLWGMVPDTITGSGTTGVMMNQFGVTDFLSLSTATEEAKQLVQAAYRNDVPTSLLGSSGAFRVAARDAFIEFLAMFKNNGIVWFRNTDYTALTADKGQVTADAWSPITGTSTFQNAARRNDVMTRGRVVMTFRNARYSGYFKALSIVEDAKNPFRWNFTFTFQVESTQIAAVVPQ